MTPEEVEVLLGRLTARERRVLAERFGPIENLNVETMASALPAILERIRAIERALPGTGEDGQPPE
jgi:DNA-directed RNA polymerase sigma subunit (sigma70/sigma32)